MFNEQKLYNKDSMNDYETYLAFATSVAREAGDVMRHYFNLSMSDKHVEVKADNTPVSEADKKINQLLIDCVAKTFPNHGVLGEEQSMHNERAELWVCDPIDGTVSFILGVPTAMFSLAYVVNGEPQVAVMYEPMLDKLFTATKGGGAFLNGEPVQVSARSSLQKANVGITASADQMFKREQFCKAMIADGARLSTVPGNVFKGSLVAQGRLDGYVFPGRSAHDIAAEKLVIEEAGGKVTSLDGEEQRYDGKIRGAVVSNGLIHEQIVQHLKDYGVEGYLGY